MPRRGDQRHVARVRQARVDAMAQQGHFADGVVVREAHDPVLLGVEVLEHEALDPVGVSDAQPLKRIARIMGDVQRLARVGLDRATEQTRQAGWTHHLFN